MLSCPGCRSELKRPNTRYCSNQCQRNLEYVEYIQLWKQGKVDGVRGVNAKNISGHLIRYLREKYDACSVCGWSKRNPITSRIPLEIDHIDGNSENNSEENLRLICPNCHSLTANFRNLNKGNGRSWRRLKYIKST
jgi:Zn finger protein HypA/HybF involved in hydrogenase expression